MPSAIATAGVRDAEEADRAPLLGIVAGTENFSKEEKQCAVELIERALNARDGDPEYRLLCADDPAGAVTGFLCYGRADFTLGVFDLYWIAVATRARRTGAGRRLLQAFEDRARDLSGRLLLITTTSRADYEPARRAYRGAGFELWARIPDYYGPGEDQLVFGKRVGSPARGGS